MTAGNEIGGRRVVAPMAGDGVPGGPTDGQHGLADTWRTDERHVGGLLEEAQGSELAHQLPVDRGMGTEVVVEYPMRGQGSSESGAGRIWTQGPVSH